MESVDNINVASLTDGRWYTIVCTLCGKLTRLVSRKRHDICPKCAGTFGVPMS